SNGLHNEVGTLAMARTSAPDSATSQFFINTKNNEFLNKEKAQDGAGYAVFGKVVDGMDVVRKIEKVKTGTRAPHQNVQDEPVVIRSAKQGWRGPGPAEESARRRDDLLASAAPGRRHLGQKIGLGDVQHVLRGDEPVASEPTVEQVVRLFHVAAAGHGERLARGGDRAHGE